MSKQTDKFTGIKVDRQIYLCQYLLTNLLLVSKLI